MALVIMELLLEILFFILSAVPLNLAVKFMGGRSSLLKTAVVSALAGLASNLIRLYTGSFLGGILAFIVLLGIYHVMFRMGWLRTFLAWLLQFVFLFIFYVIAVLLGFSAIAFSLF